MLRSVAFESCSCSLTLTAALPWKRLDPLDTQRRTHSLLPPFTPCQAHTFSLLPHPPPPPRSPPFHHVLPRLPRHHQRLSILSLRPELSADRQKLHRLRKERLLERRHLHHHKVLLERVLCRRNSGRRRRWRPRSRSRPRRPLLFLVEAKGSRCESTSVLEAPQPSPVPPRHQAQVPKRSAGRDGREWRVEAVVGAFARWRNGSRWSAQPEKHEPGERTSRRSDGCAGVENLGSTSFPLRPHF